MVGCVAGRRADSGDGGDILLNGADDDAADTLDRADGDSDGDFDGGGLFVLRRVAVGELLLLLPRLVRGGGSACSSPPSSCSSSARLRCCWC